MILRKLATLLPPVRRHLEAHCRLSEECAELRKTGAGLAVQRDALQQERDELQDHARRLNGELEEAHLREGTLRSEVDALVEQRDVLATERDELSAHARRLDAEARVALEQWAGERDGLNDHIRQVTDRLAELEEQLGAETARRQSAETDVEKLRGQVWAPLGHFYSPIVDHEDPRLPTLCSAESRLWESCDQPELNEALMLEWFQRIRRHYGEIPFPATSQEQFRYHFENPHFSYADAITLFGMLAELRPRSLVEIGVGYSSCAAMDTNDRYLDGSVSMSFFDPNPESLLSQLEPDDRYRDRITALRLQDAPLALFRTLRENDVLFLDTSHVVKTGSEVNDYLFRILPALRPGVVIHVHDILYPFEYPLEWVAGENRSWNEAYALRAFLAYNDVFEVLYFNDLVYNRHSDLTREAMPLCQKNTGGSLWLRKVR